MPMADVISLIMSRRYALLLKWDVDMIGGLGRVLDIFALFGSGLLVLKTPLGVDIQNVRLQYLGALSVCGHRHS